nr:hypothetical protein [Planctomonas psychrotolerans]
MQQARVGVQYALRLTDVSFGDMGQHQSLLRRLPQWFDGGRDDGRLDGLGVSTFERQPSAQHVERVQKALTELLTLDDDPFVVPPGKKFERRPVHMVEGQVVGHRRPGHHPLRPGGQLEQVDAHVRFDRQHILVRIENVETRRVEAPERGPKIPRRPLLTHRGPQGSRDLAAADRPVIVQGYEDHQPLSPFRRGQPVRPMHGVRSAQETQPRNGRAVGQNGVRGFGNHHVGFL